jgi:hypothetical protein
MAKTIDFQPEIAFEEETESKKPVPYTGSFRENAMGNLQAVSDMVLSLPGFLGAGLAAAKEAALGTTKDQSFPEIWRNIGESAGKGNIADYLAPAAALERTRGSPGYEGANKLLMSPFQGLGNIAAGGAAVATGDNQFAGELGERVDVGAQAAALLTPAKRVRPGSREFWQERNKQIQSQGMSPENLEAARDSYREKPKLDQHVIDFIEERSRTDMDAQRRDVGQMPTDEPTPYNLSPERKAALEEELNPPVEQTVANQGELNFGQTVRQDALTADETQARRFVTEGDVGSRDRAISSDSPFETGNESPLPASQIYTADQVAGDRSHAMPDAGIDFENVKRNPSGGFIGKPVGQTAAGPKPFRGPKGQRGVIDTDLLTFGTAKLWEEARKKYDTVQEAFNKTMGKFRGTFDDMAIGNAIRKATDPKSRETIVFMSPDDFHRLAADRGWLRGEKDNTGLALNKMSEAKRRGIRGALTTEQGLAEIPYLKIHGDQVVGHEGRHRMDIFKEQGMDLIPVRIQSFDQRWGEWNNRPDRLVGQDKKTTVPFPESAMFPGSPKPEGYQFAGPKSQRGVFNVPEVIKGLAESIQKLKDYKGVRNEYGHLKNKIHFNTKDNEVGRKIGGFKHQMLRLKEYERHLNTLKAKLADEPGILKGKDGKPVIVYRGQHEYHGDEALASARKYTDYSGDNGYAVFTTDNPYTASTFGESHVTPLILYPSKLIEFPSKKGRFDMFKFDEVAKNLGHGEVVVVRDVYDRGPANDTSAGHISSFKGDQYAFKDGNSVAAVVSDVLAQKIPYVPKGQRGHIGEWKRDVKTKGTAKTLIEQRKELDVERRPLKQILKEDIDPNTIQDTDFGKNLLIDQTVSILAQSKTGVGKIIKWAFDNRSKITREKDIAIRDTIEDLLGPWRQKGWDRLNLEHRKSLRSDIRGMLDVWMENIGKGELQRGHFKTDKQYEMFKHTSEGLSRKIDEWNKVREENGQKPIPKLSNYLPAIWEGDYRVWVKDQAGNNVGAFAFKNEYQARFARGEIQKAHPDMVVEDPVHIGKKETFNDFSAFEEAMRVNAGDHQATKQLQRTYSRLLQQKGFGRHGLARQNLFGYLGFEKGNLGIVNMEHALEMYVKRGENHVANIRISRLQKEMTDTLPRELQEKIPKAMDYLNDYLANARGVDLSKNGLPAIDNAFAALGEKSGFGRSAAERTISNVSGIASVFKLMTPKFMASSLLQPLAVLPKLRQMNIRAPDTNNFISSYYHALQDTIWPDAAAKDAINWASKQEHLDSTVVALMNQKFADIGSKVGGSAMDTSKLVLSTLEKHAVRIPAFLAFERALRPVFPDKIQRYEAAAQQLYYVVNYSRESSPLAYEKAGLTGEAMRPMKQYSHNYFGQFLEYAQGAKNKGEFTPLAMFMSNQALVSGLRGLIGIAEATAIITVVNSWLGTDYPTPEQWLLKSGMSDVSVFGLPSTMLGYDLSGSVNSPSIPQMFGFFPVEVAATATKNVSDYLYKVATGKDTEKDQMEALMSVAPSAMYGWISEYYSKPGQPVPHPGMNMKGTHVRTEEEKTAASLFSLKSTSEARHDAEARIFKQIWAQDAARKLSAIDLMADHVINKKPLTPEMFQVYIREGGDISTLQDTLINRVKQRMLPFNESQLASPEMSAGKIHKLQSMTEALNREAQERRDRQEEQSFEIQKQSEGDTGDRRTTVYELPTKSIYPNINGDKIREDLYKFSGRGTNLEATYKDKFGNPVGPRPPKNLMYENIARDRGRT